MGRLQCGSDLVHRGGCDVAEKERENRVSVTVHTLNGHWSVHWSV